ncbi:MAG: transcriptional regulator [Betaproteobacteria bacterium HGW-Betaproteobacteria-11]|nr:MAG: transcriptional regulator [Betaproteobacteria bacterium HGW-Betaproteobacteria-11]
MAEQVTRKSPPPKRLSEQLQVGCQQCSLSELCLPEGLSEDEFARVEALISKRRKVLRNRSLFHTSEPMEAIYAVKTGCFKNEVMSADGRTQVVGFSMAGELLGLDGIGSGAHRCEAVALEDSEVCLIPFNQIEALAAQIPTLQRHLHRLLSREIVRDQGVIMMLGTMNAEERLIAFLLNLSHRLSIRGYSPVDFYLRMSREDISSLLGLTIETVSRAFTRLKEEGLIAVEKKHVRLLDPAALKARLSTPVA